MLWRDVLARKPEVAVAVVCCVRGVECRCPILLGLFEQLRFVSRDFVRMRLFLEVVFFRG